MNLIKQWMCGLVFLSLFAAPAFSQEYGAVEEPYGREASQNVSHTHAEVLDPDEFHFGVWINYQQQFGALNDKFITIGGPSFGFNLGKYFLIGGGIYSTSFNISDSRGNENSLFYGGGIVGVRWNPNSPVVFRTQALIGAAAFDKLRSDGNIDRTTSFIIVPEVAFDIKIFGYLYLSLSASYKYIADLPQEFSKMQGLGALTGNVSVGFSF